MVSPTGGSKQRVQQRTKRIKWNDADATADGQEDNEDNKHQIQWDDQHCCCTRGAMRHEPGAKRVCSTCHFSKVLTTGSCSNSPTKLAQKIATTAAAPRASSAPVGLPVRHCHSQSAVIASLLAAALLLPPTSLRFWRCWWPGQRSGGGGGSRTT